MNEDYSDIREMPRRYFLFLQQLNAVLSFITEALVNMRSWFDFQVPPKALSRKRKRGWLCEPCASTCKAKWHLGYVGHLQGNAFWKNVCKGVLDGIKQRNNQFLNFLRRLITEDILSMRLHTNLSEIKSKNSWVEQTDIIILWKL